MLQVSNFTRLIVGLILIAGILIALPNALPDRARARLPSWWSNLTVSLGLDLQGGSYVLLEVQLDQVQKDKIESLMGDVRHALRKARIGYTDLKAGVDNVSLTITDMSRFEDAKTIIEGQNPAQSTGLLAVGQRQYDMSYPAGGRIVLTIALAVGVIAFHLNTTHVFNPKRHPHTRTCA